MKKLLLIIPLLVGCNPPKNPTDPHYNFRKELELRGSNRIEMLDWKIIDKAGDPLYCNIAIVRVDSHEYILAQSRGQGMSVSIIHSLSCTNH